MLRLCKISLSLFQHRSQISRKTRSNNHTVEHNLHASVRVKLKFATENTLFLLTSCVLFHVCDRVLEQRTTQMFLDSHPRVPSILFNLLLKERVAFWILFVFDSVRSLKSLDNSLHYFQIWHVLKFHLELA